VAQAGTGRRDRAQGVELAFSLRERLAFPQVPGAVVLAGVGFLSQFGFFLRKIFDGAERPPWLASARAR